MDTNKENLIEKIKRYSYTEIYNEVYSLEEFKEKETKIFDSSNFLASIFSKRYLKEKVLKIQENDRITNQKR